MKTLLLMPFFLQSLLSTFNFSARPPASLYPKLASYIQQAATEQSQIPAERKEALDQIAAYVAGKLKNGQRAQLIFVCTHNSRRSQMAQAWAMALSEYYQVAPFKSYSGGLEVTAFHPNAVAALQRAGFHITKLSNAANPSYSVAYNSGLDSGYVTMSKRYNDTRSNPTSKFCAVMVCSDADQKCPNVAGAEQRLALPYNDPKVADGTPDADKVYDERCRQIAREIAYLFAQVSKAGR